MKKGSRSGCPFPLSDVPGRAGRSWAAMRIGEARGGSPQDRPIARLHLHLVPPASCHLRAVRGREAPARHEHEQVMLQVIVDPVRREQQLCEAMVLQMVRPVKREAGEDRIGAKRGVDTQSFARRLANRGPCAASCIRMAMPSWRPPITITPSRKVKGLGHQADSAMLAPIRPQACSTNSEPIRSYLRPSSRACSVLKYLPIVFDGEEIMHHAAAGGRNDCWSAGRCGS